MFSQQLLVYSVDQWPVSTVSRKEFSALHARNWTWRALHCQSLKHKLKKCDLSPHLKECKLSACRTPLANCSTRLAWPQRKLCRQISSSYVEQSSWCRSPSGADSVPDHCCWRGVQNRSGSLGTDVCGLWTSPVPAWTWFGTPLATSATPSEQDARDRSRSAKYKRRWPATIKIGWIISRQIDCSHCRQTVVDGHT